MDRFTKSCLAIIVLLLAMIALRPVFVPEPVHAAKYKEYSFYWIPAGQPEAVASDFSKFAASNGWDFVGVTTQRDQLVLILAR
jgi:hypothetical protein